MRRGLSIAEAADYCGVTPSAYRNWMRRGMVPGFWPGTRRIDRLALDAALDRMSGRGEPAVQLSKFDAWKAAQDAT
jgi:transcriptional regulator with XRE-family HTH domain